MDEKIEDLTPKDELTAENSDPMDISDFDTPELRDIRIKRELSFFGERVITMQILGANAATGQDWNSAFFIADMNYEILSIQFTYAQESTDSGATVFPSVADDGTQIANGTSPLSTDFDFDNATLRWDVQTGTLKSDRRDRLIKKGQLLGMYFTGGVTASVAPHMTWRLRAIK